MGIAIFDRDLRLRRCNPTWATFIDRYTPSTASQVVPGAYFFDLSPGTEGEVMPIFERVLAGETVRLEALRLESEGIASYCDVVFAPLIEGGKVVGFVDVTTDATKRKRAEEELLTAFSYLTSMEPSSRPTPRRAKCMVTPTKNSSACPGETSFIPITTSILRISRDR